MATGAGFRVVESSALDAPEPSTAKRVSALHLKNLETIIKDKEKYKKSQSRADGSSSTPIAQNSAAMMDMIRQARGSDEPSRAGAWSAGGGEKPAAPRPEPDVGGLPPAAAAAVRRVAAREATERPAVYNPRSAEADAIKAAAERRAAAAAARTRGAPPRGPPRGGGDAGGGDAGALRSAAARLAQPPLPPDGAGGKARRYERWSAGGEAPDRGSSKASAADVLQARNMRIRAELAADVAAASETRGAPAGDRPGGERREATQRFMKAQTRLATIDALRSHGQTVRADHFVADDDEPAPRAGAARGGDTTLGIFGDGGIFDFDYSDDEDGVLDGSIFDDPRAVVGGTRDAATGRRPVRRQQSARQPAPKRDVAAPRPRGPSRPGKADAELNGNGDDLVSFIFCSSAFEDADSDSDDEPVELDEDDGTYILGYRIA